MSNKSLTHAIRAPFLRSFLGISPDIARYSYDNGFVQKWRNQAGTGDVSAFRVDRLNRLQPESTVSFAHITPGSETGGSLFSNEVKWTIASTTLTSIVVATNVGTLTFSEAHGLAVGATITISGATVDTDLNASYLVVAASVGGDTKKLTITTSSVSNGTYTDAGLVVTAWQAYSTANSCATKLLCSYSCATGEFATVRMRARSNSVAAIVCGNFSASAGQNDFGNLSALQGYAQPNAYTQASASNIVNGVYSCIDATASSSGRRWSLWTDEHSTTKASASHYLHRLSYNGVAGAGLDGIWTIYGPQCAYLFNFEYDQAGAPFVMGATVASGACLGTIRVKTSNGTAGYINVYAQS